MDSFQRRALKIINLDPTSATEKYSIIEVSDFIDLHCTNLLFRILKDLDHPLTLKTANVSERSKFKFTVAKAIDKPYANSFVQKHLWAIRDGDTPIHKRSGEANNSDKTKDTAFNHYPTAALKTPKTIATRHQHI